jgi:alkylation response protein AidB-like acyl-CoA dehydrogenase
MTVVDLTDEQQMLQRMVRDFAEREVAPLAGALDREQRFPRESWARAAELGLLGISAPEEYGGAALGLTEMCLVGEELSAVCVSTSATLLHQADLVINRFVRHGTPEQNARWLPRLCDGSAIGCLAITEPEAGSDALSMRTRATPADGGYVLNGTKTFITNGPEADVALVYARVGPGRGLGLFIVEAGTPGFAKGRKFSKMGWRGSPTGELVFDDCHVARENLIGAEGEGRSVLFAGLNSERVVMAAECVGLVRGALAVATQYARERSQFGRSIGEFQMIQQKLADIYAEMQAAAALTYRAAALVDRGADPRALTLMASSCKLLAGDLAMRATTEAVQVLGGYGYIDEFPVERFMRDAKLMQIGGGTAEIMRMLIARSLLKDPTPIGLR